MGTCIFSGIFTGLNASAKLIAIASCTHVYAACRREYGEGGRREIGRVKKFAPDIPGVSAGAGPDGKRSERKKPKLRP